MQLFLVFVCLITLAYVGAQNYCSPELCRGTRHIMCGHNGRFDGRCPRGARLVDLRAQIGTILQAHNANRQSIASGRMSRYRPAARMATMQWDNELANIASYNVRQCRMAHDQCRNTVRFRNSGQNLSIFWYGGAEGSQSVAALLRARINSWFAEHRNARMDFINRYPRNHRGPQIGHFTAMVIDKNIRIGCAVSRYVERGMNTFLLACNYASTNIVDRPIYTSSNRAGSGCRTGRNPQYPALCSTREAYQL